MPATPAACGGRAGGFAPRTPRARTRALRRCAPPVLPHSAKRGRPARHSAPRSGWCSAARRIRYADRRANTSAGGQSRPCGTLLTSWCSRGASRGPWGPTAPTPCRLAARLRLASHKRCAALRSGRRLWRCGPTGPPPRSLCALRACGPFGAGRPPPGARPPPRRRPGPPGCRRAAARRLAALGCAAAVVAVALRPFGLPLVALALLRAAARAFRGSLRSPPRCVRASFGRPSLLGLRAVGPPLASLLPPAASCPWGRRAGLRPGALGGSAAPRGLGRPDLVPSIIPRRTNCKGPLCFPP